MTKMEMIGIIRDSNGREQSFDIRRSPNVVEVVDAAFEEQSEQA